MNTTFACLFPETLPDAGFVFPLLQVFDGVVHLQAVENEPLETDSPYLRQCVEAGTLRPFSPSHLGEDRPRFLALVEDMRRHGADYISQLSMLTVAGLQRNEQMETSQALVADLLKRSDIRTREEEQTRLWQSRLVLKLGEWHDRQQADIDTALGEIIARQESLLQELREEEDSSFALTTEIAEHRRETETMLRHRLKAWYRLALHNQNPLPGIPITRHAAILDQLQEMFEKRQAIQAKSLATLQLPQLPLDAKLGTPLIDQLPALKEILAQLALPCTPEQASTLAQQLAVHQDQWQALVEGTYPEAEHEHCRLELVFFPGVSTNELLEAGCAGGQGTERSSAGATGCCIGLLSEQ